MKSLKSNSCLFGIKLQWPLNVTRIVFAGRMRVWPGKRDGRYFGWHVRFESETSRIKKTKIQATISWERVLMFPCYGCNRPLSAQTWLYYMDTEVGYPAKICHGKHASLHKMFWNFSFPKRNSFFFNLFECNRVNFPSQGGICLASLNILFRSLSYFLKKKN